MDLLTRSSMTVEKIPRFARDGSSLGPPDRRSPTATSLTMFLS
jgi:hypothetical protein